MQPMDAQLQAGFQAQFNKERQNRDAYQVMKYRFIKLGLPGFAAWADHQAEEESAHADKLAIYLADIRDIEPVFESTPAQSSAFTTPFEAFAQGAELEAQNSELIDSLFSMAQEREDEGACIELRWFVAEQEKSEAEFKTWLAQLQLISGDGAGILAMDAKFLKEYGGE